jgi:hypothetical protein
MADAAEPEPEEPAELEPEESAVLVELVYLDQLEELPRRAEVDRQATSLVEK